MKSKILDPRECDFTYHLMIIELGIFSIRHKEYKRLYWKQKEENIFEILNTQNDMNSIVEAINASIRNQFLRDTDGFNRASESFASLLRGTDSMGPR